MPNNTPTVRNCPNWIASYLDYTQYQESPEIFHRWVAVSLISAAMNRDCFMNRGYYMLYPNQYIILVGGSAVAKKSTAANMGFSIFNEVFEDMPVISTKITAQKLMQNLDLAYKTIGTSYAFAFGDELSVLVGRTGTSELMDFLTELYMCPAKWMNETKGKGVDKLEDVFLNFIACTTPKDLASMPPSMIGGGFAGRALFIYADKPTSPVSDPTHLMDTAVTAKLRAQLIADLYDIAQIAGEYKLDKEAYALYDELYKTNFHRTEVDFRLEPYQGRYGDHLLKISMIIAASNRSIPIIHKSDVKTANEFLVQVESTMTSTFAFVEFSGETIPKHIEKFLHLVGTQPKKIIQHAYALKRMSHYLNRDQFRLMVETLVESDRLYVKKAGRKTLYSIYEFKEE